MRADRSIDANELAVLEALRNGPLDTGARTEEFRRHPMGADDAHLALPVQLVDRAVCKRLEKAGLVEVDAGGRAQLTDEGRKELGRA